MILIKIGLKTARDETDVAKRGEKNQRLARDRPRSCYFSDIWIFVRCAAEFLEIKSTLRGRSTTYSRSNSIAEIKNIFYQFSSISTIDLKTLFQKKICILVHIFKKITAKKRSHSNVFVTVIVSASKVYRYMKWYRDLPVKRHSLLLSQHEKWPTHPKVINKRKICEKNFIYIFFWY